MKSKKITFDDIVFFIIIAAIIAIAIWKLFGSPTDTATLITIITFVAASEIIIWKKMFTIEKNTAISFVKMRNDINNKHNELKNLIKNKK